VSVSQGVSEVTRWDLFAMDGEPTGPTRKSPTRCCPKFLRPIVWKADLFKKTVDLVCCKFLYFHTSIEWNQGSRNQV